MFNKVKEYFYNLILSNFEKIATASRVQKVMKLIHKGTLIVGEHTYGHKNLRVDFYRGS